MHWKQVIFYGDEPNLEKWNLDSWELKLMTCFLVEVMTINLCPELWSKGVYM